MEISRLLAMNSLNTNFRLVLLPKDRSIQSFDGIRIRKTRQTIDRHILKKLLQQAQDHIQMMPVPPLEPLQGTPQPCQIPSFITHTALSPLII